MFENKKMIINLELYKQAQSGKYSARRLKEMLNISTDQARYLRRVWNDPELQRKEDTRILKEIKKIYGGTLEELSRIRIPFECIRSTRHLRKMKQIQKLAIQRVKINPRYARSLIDKPFFYDLNDPDFKC